MATIKINQVWRQADGSAWQITALRRDGAQFWSAGSAGQSADIDDVALQVVTNKLHRGTLRPMKSMQSVINDALLSEIRKGAATLIQMY